MGKKKGSKKTKMTPEELAKMEADNKRYHDLALELKGLSVEKWARFNLICAMDKAGTSGPLMRTHIDVPIATTRVANIYDYIVGRHGNSISGLQLYKDKKMEENELKVLSEYLSDAGYEGVPYGEPKTYPQYDLMYDFKPRSTTCSLLLSNPHNTYDRGSQVAPEMSPERRGR